MRTQPDSVYKHPVGAVLGGHLTQLYANDEEWEKIKFSVESAPFVERTPVSAATLVWTKERPTIPGFYWIRAPQLSARISKFYHVRTFTGGNWLADDHLNLSFAYGEPVEYAGPIPTPSEP